MYDLSDDYRSTTVDSNQAPVLISLTKGTFNYKIFRNDRVRNVSAATIFRPKVLENDEEK